MAAAAVLAGAVVPVSGVSGEPGATRDGAADLGDITGLFEPRFPRYDLDLDGGDSVHWFVFSLSERRTANIGLRQLDADADLFLEDEAGTQLAESRSAGTANEKILLDLDAGTYYIKVAAQAPGANSYKLRHGVGAADPVAAASTPTQPAGAKAAEDHPRVQLVLNVRQSENGIAVRWRTQSEAPHVTGFRLLRRDADSQTTETIAETGPDTTSFTDTSANEAGQLYFYSVQALVGEEVVGEIRPKRIVRCSTGDLEPAPTAVEVTTVPVVVDSTADDYFVLYVLHDRDDGTTYDVPVSMTKGVDGATTLSDNLKPLDPENYRVEKYLVDEPADIDGDCVDDIAELHGLGKLNPLNQAPTLDRVDGSTALPDHDTFQELSYQGEDVLIDIHLKNLEFVKFWLLDMESDNPSVLFMNTETHRVHQYFMYKIDQSPWGLEGPMRGEIVFHPDIAGPDGRLGIYRYEFQPTDAYSFEAVAYAQEVLAAAMPLLEDNLYYYPMPGAALRLYDEERALYDGSRVRVVLDDDLIPDVEFIALNQGEGFGLLRVIEPGDRPHPRDIVIYGTLPNDLPRVGGIITAVPQTPLSHVNLRAIQNNVPNAFVRGALDDEDIEALVGGHVNYSVTPSGYSLRAATKAEVDAHYEASRPVSMSAPERDLSITAITPLSDIDFDDWTAFGVKAANVAVLGTLGFPDGTVPDGFAVPFYFYDEFMKANDLYSDVEEMLADPDFQSDYDAQEEALKDLRKKIKKATTPAWIITALTEMHDSYPEGTSLRYRSSTNNEDLPDFSGAGLYDSKTQDPEETIEDGIDKSIKGVWASLWNFGAFLERDFHRVDHMTTAMGVLVHPNYSDELANGVAVSFDPVLGAEGSYYINTQIGEDLVTNPDEGSLPEEILLHGDNTYTVLAESDQTESGDLLMSDDQMLQLRGHLEVIHDRFAELYCPNGCEPFAIEIEFKITEDDTLAIKQARPWVFGPELVGNAGIDEPPTTVPVRPTGLSAEVWSDLVVLDWDDPLDGSITGYRIYRRDTRWQAIGNFPTIEANTESAATAYRDTGVAAGVRYVYRVAAVNNLGESDRSTYVNVSVPTNQPSPAALWPPRETTTLGDISTLSGLRLVEGHFVEGRLETHRFSFTLSEAATVGLSLGFQFDNIDLRLKDHTGETIAESGNGSDAIERIVENLAAGDYTVEVEMVEFRASPAAPKRSAYSHEYRLRLFLPHDGTATSEEIVQLRLNATDFGDLTHPSGRAYLRVPSSIGAANDTTKFFRFEITEPRQLVLRLPGATAAIQMTFEDEDSNTLWEHLDPGIRRQNWPESRLQTVLVPGVYYLRLDAVDLVEQHFEVLNSLSPAPTGYVPMAGLRTPPSPLWSASMTTSGHWVGQGYGGISGMRSGSISTSSFEVDGVGYTVNLVEASGWLYIGFDQTMPFEFTLEVDGERLESSGANYTSYPYSEVYWWQEAQVTWSEGDTVELKLYRSS